MRTFLRSRAAFCWRSFMSGVEHGGNAWNHNKVVGTVLLATIVSSVLGLTIPNAEIRERFGWAAATALVVLILVGLLLDGAYLQWQKLKGQERIGVEVLNCAIPRFFPGSEGVWLVLPALRIVNHGPNVEIDLTLDLRLAAGISFLLPLYSTRVPQIGMSDYEMAGGQLSEPLTLGRRLIGYAVFLLEDEYVQVNLGNISRASLLIDDGVRNHQIADHEVWPSIWPSILGREEPETTSAP